MQYPICGIDYSLNSPAITFLYPTSFKTYFYWTKSTLPQLDPQLFPIPNHKKQCYYDKIIYNSHLFIELIKEHCPGKISIESYSLGSVGRFTSLIENQGYLKVKLYKEGFDFQELSPSTIKKRFVGNGRAKKEEMVYRFNEITGLNLFETMYINNKNKKIESPITDIADSFAIAFVSRE